MRTKKELFTADSISWFPTVWNYNTIYIDTSWPSTYLWSGTTYIVQWWGWGGSWDVTASWTLTNNTIILWWWTKIVKSSSKTITTTLGSDDLTIPTSKAINDVIVHNTWNETIAWDKTFSWNTSTQSLNITGTNGAWHIHLKHQATDPTATWSSTAIFADTNWNFKYKNNWLSYVTFSTNANTADRVYTFPDKTWNVILDTSLGDVINSSTEKTTPIDADMVGIMDSGASNVFKKLSWANIKTTLKTYFDSLTTTFTNKTLALWNNAISGTKTEFNTACTDWDFIYSWDNATSLNMNTSKILWRSTASAGAVEEISVWTWLSLSGGTLSATWSGGGGWFWTAMPWTPTRASNTTFTVTGDVTAYVAKWMIIKWTESSTVRCAMVSIPSTYSAPNTTITIIGDTMASIDASSLKYAMLPAEIKDFNIAWTIWVTGTDVARAYYAPFPMRVIWADLQVWTAWTTNNTTVDINKWGTTIFTTKPTLATTVASSPTPFTADTATSLALWDKVTIDIDAVQTTSAVDLYVQLYLFPTRYLSLT